MPKGKAEKKEPASVIGSAIFSAIKPIYKEGERARRGRARALRRSFYVPKEPKWSQKEIVFEVLRQAIENAGTLFSARDLFYVARPLCYSHQGWPSDEELDYRYFSQALLTEYQERSGTIRGLWRDPRGHLHEPHTSKMLSLGTREVATYEFPPYTFDKLLYVEKEGEWPKLKEARLAERYDMGIVSGKGYPVEATRALFQRAQGGEYQLFVFHDADIDGYNIARFMREETRRMPGYSVEVIDLGLSVADALEMGLEAEPFSRKKGIPWELGYRLSEVEREYFRRRRERFELNAILPSSRRIEYVEEKLEENGVRGKVIPPEDKLSELAEEIYRQEHGRWVEEVLHDLVSLEEVKKEVADEFMGEFELENAQRFIEDGFEEDRALSWRGAFKKKLGLTQEKHTDALKEAVRRRAIEALEKM